MYSVRPLICFAFVCRMVYQCYNKKRRRDKTCPRRLAGQRTSSVIGRRGWVQNILITSLVLSRDLLVPKDGRIVCWGRVRVWRCEILPNGLLEGIIASEIAELSLWSGEWQYDGKKKKGRLRTLTGLFMST